MTDTAMIQIQNIDFNGQTIQAVDARTLHNFLGVKKKFADWIKDRIDGFEEGYDFMSFSQNGENGGKSHEYTLTIEAAKQISMAERNEKGKEVRKYFIEVEKSYKKVVEQIKTPKTYLEALKEAVAIQERLELTSGKLAQAEETIKSLTHSGRTYTSTEIAKELGMRSAQQLNNAMKKREMQYWINDTWVLRSWYSDKDYTSMKQVVLDNGKIIYNRHWTEKGRQFLIKKFTEKEKNEEETKLLN